jgi:putative peptidoglycan lipid II flippase
VLAPGFYARQNIKTPVKIAIFTLLSTQVMNLVFIWPFKHAGLALAISLGACLNAGLLFYHLRRDNIYQPQPGWLPFLLKLGAAVSAMALVLWVGMGGTDTWLHYHVMQKLTHLSFLVVAGVGTYFGVLWLLGFRLQHFTRRAV